MGGRGSSSGKAGRRVNEQKQEILNNPLVKGVPESERKDFYYHTNSATGRDVLSGEAILLNSDAIKYENILVNVDLPEISGTEKQVKYAKDLLRKSINRQISQIEDATRIEGTKEMKEKKKAQIDELIAKTNKTFGTKAETLSDVVNESIKRKGALKFAKENPTARAIIDKYR